MPPGKAYTMKELKSIVDYLIDHNAYGETKARKMWMDYANSGITNRTWQSLKETFLKRILPDIHNPYYKLTMDQIRSFRGGVDVTNKPANKLLFEVYNAELRTDVILNELPSTSNNFNDPKNMTGEDKICSKVSSSRDSVETFILCTEECTENIKKPINELEEVKHSSQGSQKCYDIIKNIVDDFQSDTDVIDINTQIDNLQSQSILNNLEPGPVSEDETGTKEMALDKTDDSIVAVEPLHNNVQYSSLPDSLLPNNPEELQKQQNAQESNTVQIQVKTGMDNEGETSLKKSSLSSLEKNEVKKKNKKLTLIKPVDETENKKSRYRSPIISSDITTVLKKIGIKSNAPVTIDSKGKKNVKDSTTNTKIVKHVRISSNDEIIENKIDLTNPCLQSVSLFEEQLKSLEDAAEISDTSNEFESVDAEMRTFNYADKTLNTPTLNNRSDAANETSLDQQSEVLVLKSHSESDTEIDLYRKPALKVIKTKSLNNLFENNRGELGNHREKPVPIASRNRRKTDASESTEWTSESDGEYISPPRSRNRYARKCLKPSSSRILSLEQDGGLFVACGKNVYPIVKDGKMLKHFLKYIPDSDTDDNDSYWKVKYVEERKKTAKLQRILENMNEECIDRTSNAFGSPILPSKSNVKDNRQTNEPAPDPENVNGTEIALLKATEIKEDEKTVKIKFAKDNEEVFLEGHWQNIHPILPEVMQLFQKETSFKVPNIEQRQSLEIQTDRSTPVIKEDHDDETRKKVDAMENRIFQEIEDIDRGGHVIDATMEYMVSRRKRSRCRKECQCPSPPKAASPKPEKLSKETSVKEEDEIIVNETKLKLIDAEVDTGNSRRAGKHSKEEHVEIDTQTAEDDDSSILYRFPSPRSKAGKRTRSAQTNKRTYGMKLPRIYSSDNLTIQSESSQGYQDSDASPFKYNVKRKKRFSISSLSGKLKYSYLRKTKTQKYFDWDASDESSNSSSNIKTQNITVQNSSLSTEAYRSESFQLLMPQVRSFRPLRKITESPCPNDMNSLCDLDLSPATQDIEKTDRSGSNSFNTLQIGNSSNVSLPLSPELSIVENISISKSVLPDSGDHPTINETQSNEAMDENYNDKYVLSKVDVTMPLMSQTCVFKTSQTKNNNASLPTELTTVEEDTAMSVSVLDKIDTDNLLDNVTVSDSLEIKLKNMLLESAKKIAIQNKKTEFKLEKEVCPANGNCLSKKRCSTPRKKDRTKKNKGSNVIEECMEFCSSGRKSCPPVVTAINSEKPFVSSGNSPVNTTTKKKIRKQKKNVIKVKILKPKPKKKPKSVNSPTKNKKKNSQVSMLTDSGINDTISSAYLHSLNDDIDLIHNHSETCLQANECLSNSVELVEKSNTIITISTCSSNCENKENLRINSNINIRRLSMTPDMFCTDARDATSLSSEPSKLSNGELNNLDAASLITEDLSDEPVVRSQSNDWYLLSDAEFTNTLCNSIVPAECTVMPKSSYGANLEKLFPIACAVPDLSTITELSRETDINSRKSMQDNDWNTLK